MLYQVNYICLLNGNNELLEKWMKRINTEIENYSKDFGIKIFELEFHQKLNEELFFYSIRTQLR
jgi:hypothetical protein